MSRTICVTDDTPLEKDLDSRTALAEASRCLLCHDAPYSEACHDGGHQAIDWDEYTRTPTINGRCVGCHLCLNVCPVENCILPEKTEFKARREPHPITVKQQYG